MTNRLITRSGILAAAAALSVGLGVPIASAHGTDAAAGDIPAGSTGSTSPTGSTGSAVPSLAEVKAAVLRSLAHWQEFLGRLADRVANDPQRTDAQRSAALAWISAARQKLTSLQETVQAASSLDELRAATARPRHVERVRHAVAVAQRRRAVAARASARTDAVTDADTDDQDADAASSDDPADHDRSGCDRHATDPSAGTVSDRHRWHRDGGDAFRRHSRRR